MFFAVCGKNLVAMGNVAGDAALAGDFFDDMASGENGVLVAGSVDDRSAAYDCTALEFDGDAFGSLFNAAGCLDAVAKQVEEGDRDQN
jgi:hypothetical protein